MTELTPEQEISKLRTDALEKIRQNFLRMEGSLPPDGLVKPGLTMPGTYPAMSAQEKKPLEEQNQRYAEEALTKIEALMPLLSVEQQEHHQHTTIQVLEAYALNNIAQEKKDRNHPTKEAKDKEALPQNSQSTKSGKPFSTRFMKDVEPDEPGDKE